MGVHHEHSPVNEKQPWGLDSKENGLSFSFDKFHFQHPQSCGVCPSLLRALSLFQFFFCRTLTLCFVISSTCIEWLFFFWIDAAVQLVSAWTPEKMRGLPQCSQWKDIPGGKFFEQNQIYFAMANSQRKGQMEQEQWWKKNEISVSNCFLHDCLN